MTNDELESALKSLAPLPIAIDRDQLMFDAGRASAARGLASSFWKATTGVMTAASVALALMLAGQQRGEPGSASGQGAGGNARQQVVHTAPLPPVAQSIQGSQPTSPRGESVWAQTRPVRSPVRFGDPRSNYLALRAVALERGLDALPREAFDYVGEGDTLHRRAATARELLQELLPATKRELPSDDGPPVGVSPHREETLA